MRKVRVGVIGVGYAGTEHIKGYLGNPNAEIVAICSRNEAHSRQKMKELNFTARYFSDFKELLEKGDVDAVSICSPNYLHAPMSMAAAEMGKHILCEKPIAINLEEAREMVKAVKKAGIKFLCGYQLKFNPLFQQIKRMVSDGSLGRIFFAESDYIHYVPPSLPIWSTLRKRSEAGSLFNAGSCHCVDLLRWMVGEVEEVFAYKDTYLRDVETEDTAIAILRFENGAIGKSFFCLGSIRPYTFNFNIYGTKGTIVENKLCLDTFPEFYASGREYYTEFPKEWIPKDVPGIAVPYHLEINHFIDCIVDDKEPITGVEDGARTTEVCLAAMDSAEKKRPIKLPLD